MICTPFERDGMRGFLCTSGRHPPCTRCGKPAQLLCDWKIPERKSGTCDAPICARCTHKPAEGKDLCPAHATEWKARA